VFLTGATGFVGRFVLAELLRRAPGVTAHCLVRADSPALGLDRIRQQMTAAEIWDEAFAGRITVWTGDIGEPLLGLAEEDFARLADEVDAVYHLAADLNLISSYSAVRETNTRSLAGVLELALTRRVKHVIYASTMGIFPQYFGNFAGEFAGMRIDEAATPDIALMRSVLPPGLVGYPWSKLVAEQGLLFAQACGVPVAIMRLPQTGIAAATGFTQSSDIKVRIGAAVIDTGLAPAGFQAMWTEPVDTVSEILVRLSLRPRRRHAIYHLVNPRPATHGLVLADFGLAVREVSYQEFKRACQARGARGPLHGHWPLIDHFADLWFPGPAATVPAATGPATTGPQSSTLPQPSQDRPVDVASVAADLGTAPPPWPGLITATARSLSWIGRHPGDWPYSRPAVSLDAESLRRQAREFAARLEVKFDDAYPPELLDGLEQVVAALRARPARLREDQHAAIGFDLGRKLWNRASLAAEFARHPQISRERIDRPVFIVGINRTGTTLLHRLLARGTRFWAPYPDEIVHPALPGGCSPDSGQPDARRRRYAEDLMSATGIAEAMRGIHAVDAAEPEEEFALLEESFAAWTYTLRFAVPGYARWLAGRDAGFAYGVHRQALRHLNWQRGTRLGEAPRQWLLKMPFHLAEPLALVAAYPDAVFIQTHRSPAEFLPSWLSLAEAVRSLSAHSLGATGKAALGTEQLTFMSQMLEGVARLRAAAPGFDRRFIDVSYLDLVADPVGAAEEIYRHAGWAFDEQTRSRMERWHAGQAAQRRARRRHEYSLSAYGLTEGQVEGAFSGYAEFVRANKIRMR
jgi:thioester reductase-like protein